jgi:hypothetical protein
MVNKYNEIVGYYEVDCKVMWEFVNHLRNNNVHTNKTHGSGNAVKGRGR